MDQPILTPDEPGEAGCSDWTLNTPSRQSAWITVGNISVQILREEDGVAVRLYPHYKETDEPLDEAHALFEDGNDDPEWYLEEEEDGNAG